MKLEVGMYVRTDNGIIGKLYEQIGDMFTYKDSNRDYITYGLSHNEILKASFNIIDLIEAGDYVNGAKVDNIILKDDKEICFRYKYAYEKEDVYTLHLKNIKSIVTKEQFEAMKYEIK